MRMTEAQIRRIIKEELLVVLEVQDPSVKYSFLGLGKEKAKPLATFKLGEIVKNTIPPTNDKDRKELSSFISSINQELKRLGAKSAIEGNNMLNADKDLVSTIVKKEGQYYIKNEKYNILVGGQQQIVDFARITGIEVDDLPKVSSVYAGLPPKSSDMGALANQLQGGTYGLAKGMRENKRK